MGPGYDLFPGEKSPPLAPSLKTKLKRVRSSLARPASDVSDISASSSCLASRPLLGMTDQILNNRCTSL